MITNKDIRVENGFLIINGDKHPLDGQSPEAIMQIVEDNSDSTPTENSTAPITSGGVYTADKTISDTIGDITQTGVTGADVAAQITASYEKVKRLTPVDENYTCQSTNLEYTGKSILCPLGHLYIVRAQISYSSAQPLEICATSSSSSVDLYTTYARTDKASFITFMLTPGETAYLWGKWNSENKTNAVRYNIVDITL